jgi:transposase
MGKRKRRRFTTDFKADAARLCNSGGRTIAQVAIDLDLTETALRDWVKRAAVDAGQGPPSALTTAEREELGELRRRVKRLEMEREILKNCLARRSRAPARRETPGVPTIASREEWPSTFWCSTNP